MAHDLRRGPVPETYKSAAFVGRGNAGVAVADYEDALFYNPAGTALYDPIPLARSPHLRFTTFEENIAPKRDDGLYKRLVIASPMVETSKTAVDEYRTGSTPDADPVALGQRLVGKNLHVGAANFTGVVLRRLAVGAFTYAQGDAMLFKNADYGGLETAAARVDAYAGIAAGIAHDVWKDHLYVGVSYRWLQRGVGHVVAAPDMTTEELRDLVTEGEAFGQGRGAGGDVGMILRSSQISGGGGKWRLWSGLTVRDVGTTTITPENTPAPDLDVPQTLNAGIGVDFTNRTNHVRLVVDWRDATRQTERAKRDRLAAGLELWTSGTLGIQGGVSDGYPTAGVFLDLALLRLDAAMYAAEMGAGAGDRRDDRYLARLTLGL